MKQTRQCNREQRHQSEIIQISSHRQARTRSAGVPLHEKTAVWRTGCESLEGNETAHLAQPAELSQDQAGWKHITRQDPPRPMGGLITVGIWRWNPTKGIAQMTGNWPGSCQIMADFKRNQCFSPWGLTNCSVMDNKVTSSTANSWMKGRQRRRFFRRFRAELILFGSSIQSSLSKVLGLPPINRDRQASLQRQVTQLRQVTATDGMKHLKSPSMLKHKAPRPKGGWAGGEILNCCYSWEHFWCQNSLSIYGLWRLPAHQRVNQQKISRESSK